jgi:hypothetical protein
LVFLQHALGDRVQGNWPAILYPAAAIAAGGLTAPIWRRLVWPSACLGFAIAFVLYGHAATGWPVLGARDPVARQLFGWNDLATRAKAAGAAAGAAFIAAEPYALAAELSWALPSGTEVLGVGTHWAFTALPRAAPGDSAGILVVPERYGPPDPARWRDVSRLQDIVRAGDGADIERYAVFLVRAADGVPFPGVILPRRDLKDRPP